MVVLNRKLIQDIILLIKLEEVASINVRLVDQEVLRSLKLMVLKKWTGGLQMRM
jgi:hypothetical protein